MSKYLYSANVNGIQSYIFETGKLKEIVGGSELIEYFCKGFFEKMFEADNFKKENLILSAAGKIQYLFEDEDLCRKVVRNLPIKASKEFPGLLFSQAVQKVAGNLTKEDFDRLNEKLGTQKNKEGIPLNYGLMIAQRAQKTAAAAVKEITGEGDEKEKIDLEQQARRDKSENIQLFEKFLDKEFIKENKEAFATDFKNLLNNKETGWIAVIHADGNGLGKKIQSAFKTIKDKHSKGFQDFVRKLSNALDDATQDAVREAFEKTVLPRYEKEKLAIGNGGKGKAYVPIRPIILGGDDLTLVIRGEFALDFTDNFLQAFEKQTELHFKRIVQEYEVNDFKNGLTACAGIAYIKHNYPFHYGVDLAESLCKHAKKISKQFEVIPSSLAFHRVQSSFVESYETTIDKELTIGEDTEAIRLDFGPYFLKEQTAFPTILKLRNGLNALKADDAPQNQLREWLTLLKTDPNKAEQRLIRLERLNRQFFDRVSAIKPIQRKWTKDKSSNVTIANDLISLSSIENQS